MKNFPIVSEMRFVKLTIHFVFLMVIVTISTRFGENVVSLVLGHPIEKDANYVSSVILITWLLYAIKSGKYQKQDSKSL